MIAAGVDAFGTAFTLRRVDEDSKLAALPGSLFLDDVEILVGDAPLRGHSLAGFFIRELPQSLLQRRRLHDLAQDCSVRAFRHAIHATDTILCDELGNIGSDIAEVTEGAGGGGNDTARYLIIGF